MAESAAARTVDQLATSAPNAGQFATQYFDRLKRALDGMDVASIARFAEVLDRARQEGRTIFVAGNGGSATTASSMANDLGFDIIKKTGTDKPFRFLALTDNNAVMTAIANDVGYDDVFINQLKIHYRSGDVLVLISASGNSPNAVRAAEFVRKAGGTIVSLLGFTGGKLKGLSDVVVHVPSESGEYGPVEDAHLVVNHVLAHWFQAKLRSS
jgi:D-sedoheptulose 7-phosphate isomerase